MGLQSLLARQFIANLNKMYPIHLFFVERHFNRQWILGLEKKNRKQCLYEELAIVS